jgi:uncharacterized protein
MLLEFELENDGAFAARSTISLIASALREPDDGRVVEVGDAGDIRALTSALILGKNGSGKSTLVGALNFISSFVRSSANESDRGDEIGYEPNLLMMGLDKEPTRYRLTFSMRKIIYEFEFAHTAKRITYESMQIADQSVRFRKMYERIWNPQTEDYSYSFGEALSGRRSTWRDNTRDNALFISTACQLNSEDLQPAYDWLTRYLKTTHISGDGSGRFTAKKCLESDKFRKKVVAFLQAMDINVEDIKILEEPYDDKFLRTTFAQEFIDTLKKHSSVQEVLNSTYKILFMKRNNDGKWVEFNISKESTGTRALFDLAGPLFDSLRHGYCLLIDEINTSLHPLVVSFLVDLFSNKKVNSHRAQLLFTSHDTSVLARKKMRRDQIWVIDNDDAGATLVPLSDFSPRREEALDKGYLGGRYGGVPILTPALLAVECDEE